MPEIIVNTSPLQYLHQAGCMELLPRLFSRIIVPHAVTAELSAGRRLGLPLPEPENLDWVDVVSPISVAGAMLSWDLGSGESSVLSLALERRGSWVILDDRLARRGAIHLKVPLLGTAGVLLRAKKEGHLEAVVPVLDRLIAAGFRMNSQTFNAIRELARE